MARADLLAAVRQDAGDAYGAAFEEGRKRRAGASGGIWGTLTLEQLLERPDLVDLPLSPAQRAWARVADGLQPSLSPERMNFHFGVTAWPDDAGRPLIVFGRTGVRGGKSLMASSSLFGSAIKCQFRRPPESHEQPGSDGLVGVRPGEFVRSVIVAPFLRLTKAPFEHLKGTIDRSPLMASLLVERPNTERIRLRRPDGNVVDIEPVAAAQGGANLRSTWLAGALFDEADFHDDDGAAVDLVEQIRACIPRMLRGAQIWITTSPFTDTSQFHALFTEAFGKPIGADGKSTRRVAFHSDSLSMNPTLDRDEIARARATDPDQAACEYDAVPRTNASLNFFPEAAIASTCVRPMPYSLPPNGRQHYGGSDLGFSKNSSALALACELDGKTSLSLYVEKIPEPGRPLSPSMVCAEFGDACIRYNCDGMKGDSHYKLSAVDEFSVLRARTGKHLSYIDFTPGNAAVFEAFTEFKRRMVEGNLILPADPRLIKQLRDTKVGRAPGGGVKVILPVHGAAHGDVLMSVVLACIQVPPRAPGHVERGMLKTNPFPF